ncbi:MAG: hypothetical protein WB445_02300 [Acinetobacter sp.]
MANEKALTFSKNAKTLADTSHKGAMPCLFPAAALNLKQLQKRSLMTDFLAFYILKIY